eukprot:448377-Pleurochrysis_carterae.AAC.1
MGYRAGKFELHFKRAQRRAERNTPTPLIRLSEYARCGTRRVVRRKRRRRTSAQFPHTFAGHSIRGNSEPDTVSPARAALMR